MTVITMPFSEKKSDNVPLVNNIELDPAKAKDLEAGNVGSERTVRSRFLVLRVINDSVYSLWTVVYILLMSLLITIMMLYGESIYRAIGRAFQEEDASYYKNLAQSSNDYDPIEDNQLNVNELKEFQAFSNHMEKFSHDLLDPSMSLMNPGADDVLSEIKSNYQEQAEDNYENIVSNSARFIHDFSANVTGIVDVVGKRCFIMPLNRTAVTPPKSLYDLLFKMSSGYYAVDTKSVMHNMQIVKPAVEDLTPYGVYISKDCAHYPTFKLEKIVSGVFKRSVPSGGKAFVDIGQSNTFNIVNYHEAN